MIEIQQHQLVPMHEILSKEEKKALLEKLGVTEDSLPKVFINDPAIRKMETKPGTVMKITRKSPTAGETVYYRVVIEK